MIEAMKDLKLNLYKEIKEIKNNKKEIEEINILEKCLIKCQILLKKFLIIL